MQKCIHCLELANTTRDHVFPKSWYPDNTPEETQRPTAPSCAKCNNELGRMEEELFTRLAPCIDPNKLEALGINKKLLRRFGIGKESELNPKELARRKQGLIKFLKETEPYDPNSGPKPFPNLGPHAGFPLSSQRSIRIPAKELKAVSLKIVRGLEYCLNNSRYIMPPYEAEIYFVEEGEGIADVNNVIARGATQTFGPGFLVERAEAKHEPHSSVLYRITVWGTWILYGSVMLPVLDENEA